PASRVRTTATPPRRSHPARDSEAQRPAVSRPISHAVGAGPARHCTALQAQWFTGAKVTLDHLFFPFAPFPHPEGGGPTPHCASSAVFHRAHSSEWERTGVSSLSEQCRE